MSNDDIKRDRVVIQVRVSAKLKEGFNAYCESLGTTMSDELKRYMTNCHNTYYAEKLFREHGLLADNEDNKD